MVTYLIGGKHESLSKSATKQMLVAGEGVFLFTTLPVCLLLDFLIPIFSSIEGLLGLTVLALQCINFKSLASRHEFIWMWSSLVESTLPFPLQIHILHGMCEG